MKPSIPPGSNAFEFASGWQGGQKYDQDDNQFVLQGQNCVRQLTTVHEKRNILSLKRAIMTTQQQREVKTTGHAQSMSSKVQKERQASVNEGQRSPNAAVINKQDSSAFIARAGMKAKEDPGPMRYALEGEAANQQIGSNEREPMAPEHSFAGESFDPVFTAKLATYDQKNSKPLPNEKSSLRGRTTNRVSFNIECNELTSQVLEQSKRREIENDVERPGSKTGNMDIDLEDATSAAPVNQDAK